MSEPFIGQIVMFAGSVTPRGWAFCNGQLLEISKHRALFSVLGTTYGGDGRTNFALPDLRGRFAMHPSSTLPQPLDAGSDLTPRDLGESGGQEDVTLAVNQMPVHSHTAEVAVDVTVKAVSGNGNQSSPEKNVLAASAEKDNAYSDAQPDTNMSPEAVEATAKVAVENAGANMPHTNLPPYQCINFIIAIQGKFPSRG